MKKKVLLLVAALVMTVAANAQFQQGKGYIGASLTGLDMHYNGADKFNLGFEAKGGYLFMDNLMGLAFTSFEHKGHKNTTDNFMVGAGARYYIIQNGLYLGVNAKLVHASTKVEETQTVPVTDPITEITTERTVTAKHKTHYNDVMPGLEVGYAFFINRSVTVEPAIYYDQSFKHSDYSTIGLKVGIGVYLFDD